MWEGRQDQRVLKTASKLSDDELPDGFSGKGIPFTL